MSKWFIALFFTIGTSNILCAQQKLEIKGVSPNLYLNHIVAPKETLYSVSRLYNSSPRELARYNGLKIESGLKTGQNFKVPLDKNNFTQSGVKARNEALIPVYHTVSSKETLYRLGANYNKVPLTTLKKWNHLSSDEVTAGTPMIVGYLKVDETQSALAQQGAAPATQAVATAQPKPATPAVKTPEVAVVTKPVVTDPATAKTEKTVTTAPPSNEVTITATPVNNRENHNFSGGYFKNLYDQQTTHKTLANSNGSAGIFKSTSGWQDGKYYCFNNDAMPGMILKITNNATGKSIYAKVLDAIPDIKQNEGLAVVISNAAADKLGAGDNKFDCSISYLTP